MLLYIFFFNDTATTEIYTLSLHDALPIWVAAPQPPRGQRVGGHQRELPALAEGRLPRAPGGLQEGDRLVARARARARRRDRKSTRLNSSHANISYAVFCLKKKTSHTHERL